MKLYLSATSKKEFTYVPDWIQISYEENGKMFDLCMDIQGLIDYSHGSLCSRVRGDLIPWTLAMYGEKGFDACLDNLEEKEIIKYQNLFIDNLGKASKIVVGVHCVQNSKKDNEYDTFENGLGKLVIKDKEINFRFECEDNDVE